MRRGGPPELARRALLVQDARFTAMTATLINTAGEPEREARSRRANAVEALGLMCVILITLWPFCYAWGVLGDNAFIRRAAQWPLALGFVWVFCGSPFWHRDTAESLGLGNPRRLWRMLCEAAPAQRWRLLSAIGAILATLNFVFLTQWPLARKFLRLPESAVGWPWPAILAVGIVLGLFVATCLVRYDNFGPALRAALVVSASLIVFAGAAAWLHRGAAAFARFEPGRWALDVFAYFFWGYFQQFFFTAYFGTRLRKGFPPSTNPRNVVPPERRARVVLLGALAAAATLAPAVWLTVRTLHGADAAPFAMLAWCIVFADRKSTRLNSSHVVTSRMPSSA